MLSELPEIVLGQDDLYSCACHPTEPLAVVGNLEGEVYMLDLASGRHSFKYETIYGAASALAFSPSGQMLAIGGTRSFKVVETQSGAILAKLEDFGNDVVGLAFSPDERLLAVACHDANLRVYTVKPMEVHKRMLTGGWRLLQKMCCGQWVQSVHFRNAEQLLWTVRDGTVRSMHPWNGTEAREYARPGEFPICVACNRTDIVVGWGDGQVSVHDFQLNFERFVQADGDWIRGLHHLSGDYFAFTGQNGKAGVLSTEGFVMHSRDGLRPGGVYGSAFHPQPSTLSMVGPGNSLGLVRVGKV